MSENFGAEIYQSTEEHPEPIDTDIKGKVPPWLKGQLIRVGPGKFEWGNTKYNHWFDGDAILNRFSIANGKVEFSSRFLRSKAYLASEKNNRIMFAQYGTNAPPDPCKNIFSRFFSYFSMPEIADNCNVNIVKIKGEDYTSTESPKVWKFDKETLETLDQVDFGEKLKGPRSWLAHPHFDAEGNYYNISTSYIKSQNEIYKLPSGEGDKDEPTSGLEMVASFPCQNGVSYYHSFGITESYFLFIESSLFFTNPLGLLFMRLMDWRYVDFFKFNPKVKSRFHLIERKTGKTSGIFSVEPFMCFHQVNAYETEGKVVLDMCGYPDASIMKGLYLRDLRQRARPTFPPAELRRYHLPLEKVNPDKPAIIELEKNADGLDYEMILHGFELPRINYKTNNGKDYTYTYGIGKPIEGGPLTTLHKVNVKTKEVKSWGEDKCYPSEPVFVPRPDAESEDDGVVLSAVIGLQGKSSFLLVLNGEDFEELARAYVPVRLIASIHGEFL